MSQNTQKYFIRPHNKEILNHYLISKNLPDYRVFDDSHIKKIKSLQINYYTLLLNSIIKKNQKTSTFSSPDILGSFNDSTDITDLITTNGNKKSIFMYNNKGKEIEIGVINSGIFGDGSLSPVKNDEAIHLTRKYINDVIDIKSLKTAKDLYQSSKRKKSSSPPKSSPTKKKNSNSSPPSFSLGKKSISPPSFSLGKNSISPPSFSLGDSASKKLKTDSKLVFRRTPPSSTESARTRSTLPRNTSQQSMSSLLSPSISPVNILLNNNKSRTPSPSNNNLSPPRAPEKPKRKGGTFKRNKRNKNNKINKKNKK
tara:strand:+ start:6250 stop:7185 length:936 start_codon:yes stop_codon:yes gene_type:complete